MRGENIRVCNQQTLLNSSGIHRTIKEIVIDMYASPMFWIQVLELVF